MSHEFLWSPTPVYYAVTAILYLVVKVSEGEIYYLESVQTSNDAVHSISRTACHNGLFQKGLLCKQLCKRKEGSQPAHLSSKVDHERKDND